MYIDIHRHSMDNGEADLILRNAFHNEDINQIHGKYFSIGLHPWHVNKCTLEDDLILVKNSSQSQKVIAIGEAGLDKSIEVPYNIQLDAFTEQIEIAKNRNLPVIIHCVRAYNELISIRKNSGHKQPWMIHWFNASTEIALDLIRKDCYLSFGNILFKENTKGYKAFQKIPLDRIFLETDDVNISILEIYDKAAELRKIPLKTLKIQITENFKNCFGNRI